MSLRHGFTVLTVAFGVFLFWAQVCAQSPKLAPADLSYSRELISKSHLTAEVELRVGENDYARFRYERDAGSEKISESDRVYVRPKGKGWAHDLAGKAGDTVDPSLAQELDIKASIVDSPFEMPEPKDKTQGGIVWKFVRREKAKGGELFTYERTREHPRPDGVYPRYTFVKFQTDEDGKLTLHDFSAQMRDGEKLVPVTIRYSYELGGSEGDDIPEIWITGEVFSKNHVLFFRTDRPVKDNPMGNVVLLGSVKAAMNVLLPMYMKAEEKHVKLRLYGSLLPFSGTIPGHSEPLPNVQFITSKAHMPSDPDELPEDQKIRIQPGDKVPGFKIEIK